MHFKTQASAPKNAVAVIFDLEGFSKFFNQPDVQIYVGAFLNRVFSTVAATIEGGTSPVQQKPLTPLKMTIAQSKFLGDGALYVLTPETDGDTFKENAIEFLVNRLWNLKLDYPELIAGCTDDVPVADLPKRIRVGIARGSVYELESSKGSQKEYIGFPLNLASRLQRYCPELAFIASARVGLPQLLLDKHGYIKVVATKIRGFPREVVLLDKNEFAALGARARTSLFEEIPKGQP